MGRAAGDLHVVLFPWSAFGHLNPFHQLAVALAEQGVRVSYVATTRNIERLRKIPPHLAPLLKYVSLPLEFQAIPDNNLPQGAEATFDLEFDQIQYLKQAYDLLRQPFEQFVSSCSPEADWIISDFASHWMPEVAQEYQIPLMYFSIFTATFLSFIGPPEYLIGEGQKKVRSTPDSLTTPPHWGSGIFPPSIAYRSFEAEAFHPGAYGNNASGVADGERLARMLQGCQAVCIRSCREFEGEHIDLYQTLIQKPVLPVGVLAPAKIEEKDNTSEPWSEVFTWLDQQRPRSVIYVAFGSETKLNKEEVYEIARGLELAQLPFIWALRKPNWAADESEALPPGFLTRTSGKGIVCLGWAPQLQILAHSAVGGSLFHSGYSSIVETLQHGHTLILLPCVIDQGPNARQMVEKGLGIEVERREDGSYTRHDIADALRVAMLGDEAETTRARARQAAALFGDQKLQEDYITKFIEYLRNES